MRLVNKHGFPVDLNKFEDIIQEEKLFLLEDLKKYLDYNYGDRPFIIIGDTEIPRWVDDYEAIVALGGGDE